MSEAKFMGSSLILFLDLIVIAASGWLYWLVISKLVSISEVGQSTTVYSLVFLTGTLVGLGLEYPLLKKTAVERSKILGSAFFIEIAMSLAVIPFMIYTLNSLYTEALQSYVIVAIGMLVSISLGYVARYALLGISASKTVLVIDTVSAAVKFATGFLLAFNGLGALGILISFMLQALVTAGIGLILAKKQFGFSFGDLRYIKKIIKDGLVNMPSILSKTVIVSLTVVLLASYGIASSEIGVFYIALMISIIAGGLVSSTAYMVIPASSISQTDLTSGSIRLGISLTAPIISLLLAAPTFLLSLIGPGYASGQTVLLILAVGILPFAIVTNSISRFNYLGMSKKLLSIGSLQMIVFIVGFIFLVPQFKGEGAALSIFLSYSISCIPALIWSEKVLVRYLANAAFAVICGWGASNIFRLMVPEGIVNELIAVLTSIIVTLIMIFVLKNTSITEVKTLIKTVLKSTA
jgi:O-antigen/teichoic acid export membrane protein